MRALIPKLLLYLGILAFLHMGLFFLSGFLSRNHRLGTVSEKHQRLTSLTGARLIFAGGSNLHYGLDSTMLETKLNIPVVNMGLQGSLGLQYMLEEIYVHTRPGDVVVLCPEWGHFSRVPLHGEVTLSRMLSKNPSSLAYINTKQLQNVVFDMGAAIDSNIQYLPIFMAMKSIGKKTIREQSDLRGDYLGHRGKKSIYHPKPSPPGDIDPQTTIDFILRNKKRFEDKGAVFLLGFSPVAKSAEPKNLMMKIFSALKKTIPDALIGHPQRYVFDDSLFFDTAYHLLYENRGLRTKQLYHDLKETPAFQRYLKKKP